MMNLWIIEANKKIYNKKFWKVYNIWNFLKDAKYAKKIRKKNYKSTNQARLEKAKVSKNFYYRH